MKISISTLCFLTVCMLAGCSKDKEEEMPPPYQNPYAPIHNGLLTNEFVLGNEDKSSWFQNIIASIDGNHFYISGELDGSQASTSIGVGQQSFQDYYESVLIKVNQQGQKIWEVRPGFNFKAMKVLLPNQLVDGKETIVLIGHDSNDDDQGRTRIMIFDSDGNFLKNHSQEMLYFHNDLLVSSFGSNHVNFISAGHVHYIDDEIKPTLYLFELQRNTLELQNVEIKIVNELNRSFTSITRTANQYQVLAAEEDGNPNTPINELAILSFNSILTTTVWGYGIQNNGMAFSDAKMMTANGNTYVYYAAEDTDKELNSLGRHWLTTNLHKFNANTGTQAWAKGYPMSDYTNFPGKLLFSNDKLYMTGVLAVHGFQDGVYGNGFVCKIDPLNGKIMGDVKDFGNPFLLQNLQSGTISNGQFWGVGEIQNSQNTSRAWTINIPVSSL